MSLENLFPILGLVPITSSVQPFLIAQIVKTLNTKNSKLPESVEEEVHLTFVDEDDDLMLEKCGKHKGRFGIGNEFLKIARQVKPLIGSGDVLSLISNTISRSF